MENPSRFLGVCLVRVNIFFLDTLFCAAKNCFKFYLLHQLLLGEKLAADSINNEIFDRLFRYLTDLANFCAKFVAHLYPKDETYSIND